jgi:hypothetical protein
MELTQVLRLKRQSPVLSSIGVKAAKSLQPGLGVHCVTGGFRAGRELSGDILKQWICTYS